MKKKLEIFELKEKFNKVRVLELMIRFQQYYDATNYCENLLNEYGDIHDSTHFYCIIARLFLIHELQPDAFDYYVTRVSNDGVLKQIEGTKYYCDYCHIVGLHAFVKHDYELAVASFQKAMEDERYFFPEMIYLYHIESTLEKEIVTNLVQRHFIEELKKRYDSNWIVLYEYFQMKKIK